MSNELSTPKVIWCPADGVNNHTLATTWAGLGDTNISYFVCWNATEAYPQMILMGDHNIGTAGVSYGNPATSILQGQYQAYKNNGIAWTANDMHLKVGNYALTDGSVQQGSVKTFQDALTAAYNNGSTNNGQNSMIPN
jgi:hypothetical protein